MNSEIIVFQIDSEKSEGYTPFNEVKESIKKTLLKNKKSDYASEILKDSIIEKIVVTDTMPVAEDKIAKLGDKMEIISIAPMLGEAISRIHNAQSVGAMFHNTEDL